MKHLNTHTTLNWLINIRGLCQLPVFTKALPALTSLTCHLPTPRDSEVNFSSSHSFYHAVCCCSSLNWGSVHCLWGVHAEVVELPVFHWLQWYWHCCLQTIETAECFFFRLVKKGMLKVRVSSSDDDPLKSFIKMHR